VEAQARQACEPTQRANVGDPQVPHAESRQAREILDPCKAFERTIRVLPVPGGTRYVPRRAWPRGGQSRQPGN
jgi:hypothetical protein